MFRKSPYLQNFPVLSLQPEQLSRYQLRRAHSAAHLCTAEVGTLCLHLANEPQAAEALQAYFEVFTEHYLKAKQQLPVNLNDAVHLQLQTATRGA
jgi:DTW domain-containing protein YfiP